MFICIHVIVSELGAFLKQSTDDCGRPAQTEPGLGAEVKVELSEWENGERRLGKS